MHMLNRLQQNMSSTQGAATKNSMTPDVARLIEERDVLLQTGVYNNSDVTIQKLDQKIKSK